MNNNLLTALLVNGTLGGFGKRLPKQPKQSKGFWYWVVIFPIKWCMIFTFGLMFLLIALVVGMLAAIPWLVVRCAQGKPLKPDFISRGKVAK